MDAIGNEGCSRNGNGESSLPYDASGRKGASGHSYESGELVDRRGEEIAVEEQSCERHKVYLDGTIASRLMSNAFSLARKFSGKEEHESSCTA